jgi:hypothetical protein
MTVAAGANAQVVLDGFNLSAFFREFAINADKAVHDATVFANVGSRAKQLGVKHGMATGLAFSDDTVNTGSWSLLSERYESGASGLYVWGPYGFAVGNTTLSLYSTQVQFNPVQVIEDLIRINMQAEAVRDAVDYGVSLHPISAEAVFPVTGTGVDNLAASTNGGVASVHVFDIAGAAPNVVYRVQHSSNGSTWADLVTFTAVTAANQSQRIEVASGTTVNRHLRITITEGGTTTSVNGLVVFARR